jgi:putative ABC transport system permease protein
VLLLGRYASGESKAQCLKPPTVVNELLSIVFRIEQLVWVSSLIALCVTLLLLALVLLLTMRLRAAEMQTMFRLGCSRRTIALLLGSELFLLLSASATVAALTSWAGYRLAADAMRQLLF